jgi:hypothetical protein
MAESASSTLRVGDRAPEFTLAAANCFGEAGGPQKFSLSQLLQGGAVLLEFLRGTW